MSNKGFEMAIKPLCNKCGKELTEFGGILLSPPDNQDLVKKSHLCKLFYEKLIEDFAIK